MRDDPMSADLDSQTPESTGDTGSSRKAEPSGKVMDFAALRTAGQQALVAGDTDAAYDYARWAMRLDANDPQVIFLMATVLADRNRFPEAIEMLDAVAKTTPQARLPALGQTADWLVRYGKWADAETRYRDILKSVPDAALAHRSLASLLGRQGRRLEAFEHLKRLCELGDIGEDELTSMLCIAFPLIGDEGDDFQPIGALGKSRIDVAGRKWKGVLARLEKVDSKDSWRNGLRDRALAVLGRWESLGASLKDAESGVDLSPDGWFAKGVHAGKADKHAVAARCFAESVQLDPTDPIVYAELAKSLDELNLREAAEKFRSRAALIESTHAIGKQLVSGLDFDWQRLIELSETLKQLRRPLEALGWRSVWLADSGLPKKQKAAAHDEIRQERERLIADGQTTASREFLLCGVDVDALVELNADRQE